jgi:hypothetical protein
VVVRQQATRQRRGFIMSTEQTDNTPIDEDVEGHRMPHRRADAERDETEDDVEGHRMPHRR